jgi:hypothetical protein
MITKKLGLIFNANSSMLALSSMKKKVKVSFKLMTWMRKEYKPAYEEAVAQQKLLLEEFGNKDDAGNLSIKPGDEGFESFMGAWAEYVMTDVELRAIPLTMEELIDALDHEDNVIDDSVLLMLEIFTNDYVEPVVEETSVEAASEEQPDEVDPAANQDEGSGD